MSPPFTSKRMRLQIVYGGTTYTLGVVELVDMEVLDKGALESKYGFQGNVDLGTTPANRHRVGMKHCRFRLRRWFKADDNTRLLFDLHNLDTEFDLKEYLTEETGFVGLRLDDCISYSYKEITGTANDIVGEEIVGEGLYWEAITVEEECNILFWDNFETDGGFPRWTGKNGNPVWSTDQAHHGTHSIKIFRAPLASAYVYWNIPDTVGTLLFIRVFIRFDNHIPYGSDLLRVIGDALGYPYLGVLSVENVWGWRWAAIDNGGVTHHIISNSVPVINTWYMVEVRTEVDTSAKIEMWINGVSKGSDTFDNSNAIKFNNVKLGSNLFAVDTRYYADCFVISDCYIGSTCDPPPC